MARCGPVAGRSAGQALAAGTGRCDEPLRGPGQGDRHRRGKPQSLAAASGYRVGPAMPCRAGRVDRRRRLNLGACRANINPARTSVRPFSDIQVTSMAADSRTALSQHARPSH
ncbi:hypothetical protein G6F22_021013 [Rhizopus arrhizus]|nr:hypothetical protein G6F22_021013 [Rhizopus arrhizus]